MGVLDVQNLSLSFGDNTLFDGVSFDIKEKEKVGFVGVNGVGKTSLFKIITGEYQPDSGACYLSKNCRLGYMEQHTCANTNTVWDELISVFAHLIETEKQLNAVNALLESTDENRQENILKQEALHESFIRDGGLTYKSMTRSTLTGLGFEEAQFNMTTDKLSGGQRSKLILAKLLLSKADFLLLDEPTNHLDINAVEWLEGFLLDFSGACLIISHDRYFLDRVTTKTIELENNKIRCYNGNYSEFLVKKDAEQKAIADKYNNDIKEIERLEGIIEQQRRWNREKNIKTAESKEKVIDRIKAQLVTPDKMLKHIRFDFTPKCVSGSDVLYCDSLSKSFGGKKLFSNVNFGIKKNERVFLLGANGCGKTTLLKILTGDCTRDDGTFKFGANVTAGYFDQVQERLDLSKTVLDEVWTSFPNLTETHIRSALAAFLFYGDEVYRSLSVCSGGERARVALLKLMLGGFNFLLLDEPTNHLDSSSREELENTLTHYGGTMLIVSHDRYFINKLATRILELTPDGIRDYKGNYDYYCEKRFVPQREKIVKQPKVNDYKLKKERAASLRKLKAAVLRIEEQIEQSEEEIQSIERKLQQPDAPYDELTKLTETLAAVTERRDVLYTQWEQACEKLTLSEGEDNI